MVLNGIPHRSRIMVKRTVMAAAGLMALAGFASPVSAQVNVTVNGSTTEVWADNATRGLGGGWNATITGAGPINFLPGSANLPVVYCFDYTRQFSAGKAMNMTLLTFNQFIAGNQTTAAINPWSNINIHELNKMAFLASTYTKVTNTATVRSANTAIQNQIWDLTLAATNETSFADLSASWMVLVDAQDWAGTGQDSRTNGVQSFLVQVQNQSVVPEPSSLVLLVAGAGALSAFGFRRRKPVA
ncbi:PEP-CTERM sorting domain-containing protein [Gemmatimonas sp.]|uniref:PEP-CTERM sorting domain-containing protein n=2 Tax=Gemmatimonas sp. TaxID=1962908 RepID=UPI00391F4311